MSITLLKKEALQLLKKNWSISIICFFFFHSIIIFLILSLESFFDLFRIDISNFSLIILLIFMFSLHPVFYIISYFTYINKKWSLEYIFKNMIESEKFNNISREVFLASKIYELFPQSWWSKYSRSYS